MVEFREFPKIPRLNRHCVITEKIDGTNAQIYIPELPEEACPDGPFWVGSRSRWIKPGQDNYGFAAWAYANADELLKLGPGSHFGEWWGAGIQRGYGLKEKRFSLFNVGRWAGKDLPACVSLVPVLYDGVFSSTAVDQAIESLKANGSVAAPGFMRPEGVVVFHKQSGGLFKVTCEKDEMAKGELK